LYFSDAQRINLLRVHQPGRYGDRIDRFTTLEAEKTGKIAYGLELGPMGTLTLRVVAPMIVNGKRIGFVELGEEINHITAKLKKTIGVELIVHLHKKFLHRPGWEAGMKMLGRAYDWDRFPDVVLVEQTLPVNPEALTKFFSEGSRTLGAIDEEIFSQKHRYRCRFLAIKDVQGVEVGNMVIMIDVTGQVTNLYYTMGVIAIFSVFLGGALFFLFRFFLGRVQNQLTTVQQKIIDLEKDCTRMESEAKFYSVAQSVNDAMISSDSSGKINFWNPAAVIMFGYQEEEVLEQPLTMLMPERYREAYQKGMERLQSGVDGRIIGKTTELFGLKKDGTEFPLELSLAQWTAGNETFYNGLIRDITKRKRAEEALRESQLHQKAILDNIPDIAWLKDKESRLIAVNEPFGKSCGFEPEDLVGKTDLDIWPRDLAERYRADDKEVMESGKRKQVEEPLKDNEGRILWIETIKTPIYDEHGDISGTAGIARDITERKRAEEKLQKTLKSLRKSFGTIIQVHDIGRWGKRPLHIRSPDSVGRSCPGHCHRDGTFGG
jgi:PAS domain S-box-containing protein